jgi:hypothetical protein
MNLLRRYEKRLAWLTLLTFCLVVWLLVLGPVLL